MKQNTCALVLAAGFSKRYGSDKRFSGQELLILRTLKNICKTFDSIYLVHRYEDKKLISLLENINIALIQAPSIDISLGTSISVGIRQIKKSAIMYESCAIFLADMPNIKKKTITALQNIQKKNLIVRAKYENIVGHPVFFGNNFFEELCKIKNQEGANQVIKENKLSYKILNVDDIGVIEDIDYPHEG